MGLAFLLGLMGSLGHCVGMCGGVTLLLSRRGVTGSSSSLLLVHLGRITTYSLLGLVAGALGQAVTGVFPGLRQLQGALALAVAGIAIYLALALVGRVSSPEIFLAGLTRRWGRALQRLLEQRSRGAGEQGSKGELTSAPRHLGTSAPPLLLGLLWGLLPCGLVLTALLPAATTGSPWHGALTMLAFGLGTWPALLGVGRLGRSRFTPSTHSTGSGQASLRARFHVSRVWPRQVAALVVFLFGTQMALRGLAAWGWVGHLHLGGVMLW